jgi:hypothetical protein
MFQEGNTDRETSSDIMFTPNFTKIRKQTDEQLANNAPKKSSFGALGTRFATTYRHCGDRIQQFFSSPEKTFLFFFIFVSRSTRRCQVHFRIPND